MITTLTSKSTLLAGLAIIALTNAIALGRVAHNRSETISALPLTEREIRGPGSAFQRKENSGLALQLEWRTSRRAGDTTGVSFSRFDAAPAWLDSTVLKRLGFDVSLRPTMSAESRQFYERQLAREAYFALELDGPAYHEWITEVRRRAGRDSGTVNDTSLAEAIRIIAKRIPTANLSPDDSMGTRLFVVDADADLSALRARHPDSTRYAFVPGTVQPRLVANGPDVGVYGSIKLLIRPINVPHALRSTIVPNGSGPRTGQRWAKPFTMTVGFGRRLEPFIIGTTTTTPAK